MNKRFEKIARRICRHGMILAKGFARTLYGALTAGLAGVAIATFTVIPGEGGYAAVCDFIVAVATMVVALCCAYSFGRNWRRVNKNK